MSTATTPDKPRIGWIGLGKMGLPICERLAAQQFQLTTLYAIPKGASAPTARSSKAIPKLAVLSAALKSSFLPSVTTQRCSTSSSRQGA